MFPDVWLSPVCSCLSLPGEPKLDTAAQDELHSDEQGGIPSLTCWWQRSQHGPGHTPPTRWLLFSLLLIRCPRAFSSPTGYPPENPGPVPPQGQDLVLLLVELDSLAGSLWTAAHSSGTLATPARPVCPCVLPLPHHWWRCSTTWGSQTRKSKCQDPPKDPQTWQLTKTRQDGICRQRRKRKKAVSDSKGICFSTCMHILFNIASICSVF